MQQECVFITGVNGEIGHGLVTQLKLHRDVKIVALDITPPDDSINTCVEKFYSGDILNHSLIEEIFDNFKFTSVFHLASILSTSAERDPERAHHVNVDGTLNLLIASQKQSFRNNYPIKFLYPSSIAVYGMQSIVEKKNAGKVKEQDHCDPITMYGCNKIYCEKLGSYYSNYYRILSTDESTRLDFRGIRFPGLISAITVPTGGTSDYGPEMLHHAAQRKPYACFVREDTTLPFMVMPDAIKALLELSNAAKDCLSLSTYNVTSFNPSANNIFDICMNAFPDADIRFVPDPTRQKIVDSWPQDIDDSSATKDWGWRADYDFYRSFNDYLIPAIKQRYSY